MSTECKLITSKQSFFVHNAMTYSTTFASFRFVGIHPDYIDLPASEYVKVGKSTIPNGGRGLFASKNIPYYGSLALGETSKAFHFPPLTWSVIERLLVWAEANEDTIPYVEDEIASIFAFAEG